MIVSKLGCIFKICVGSSTRNEPSTASCDRYEPTQAMSEKAEAVISPLGQTVGKMNALVRAKECWAQITKLSQGNGYLLAISSSDTSSSTVSSSTSFALFLAFIWSINFWKIYQHWLSGLEMTCERSWCQTYLKVENKSQRTYRTSHNL